MADNHFDAVIVWDNVGGGVRVNPGGKASVLDPDTDATLTVVQDGVSVTTITADSSGRAKFIAQQGIVTLLSGGLTMTLVSSEQATAGASNAAAAAASAATATSAKTAAETAQAAAEAAQAAAEALADAATGVYLPTEGVSLYSYGHSYTMWPSPYTSPNTGEYMERVRTRLRMGTGYFRGRSATFLTDHVAGMLAPNFITDGGISRTWVPGSRGIVLSQNFMNEAANSISANSAFIDGWKNGLRSFAAIAGSASKINVASATLTGTWTTLGSATKVRWSAEDVRFSSTIGNTAAFTVTGDEAWVVAAMSDTSYGLGSWEAKIGATVLRTVNGKGQMFTYTDTVDGVTAVTYTACAYKITGMNAAAGTSGSKTLTIRQSTSGNVFVNCVLLPATAKPHIFYGLEPTRNPAATSSSGVTNFNTYRAAYIAAANSVASEFANMHVVDLEPGWDNSTMVASLDTANNFHPNDLGMANIADNFVSGIRAAITAPTDGVMVL